MTAGSELKEVIEETLELLVNFSIPLYYTDDYNRPIQFGTGFFVRGGPSYYLVTAAHVLDTAHEREVFYYVAPNKIRKLTGVTIRSGKSPFHRNDDLVDIGVIRLTGDGLPPYPEIAKFAMEPDYLRPRYLPRAGRSYAVIGFPATKSKVCRAKGTVLVVPHAYRCEPILDQDYGKYGFSPENHVLLQLDLKVGFGTNGEHQHFPKPQGMSGSPIIILYSDGPADDARVFPVVAVGIEYHAKQRLLIGTDVSHVIEAIEGPLRGSLVDA
jgi:hypothetical protein